MKLGYNELGYNELGYNKLGYNALGYNDNSVITNRFLDLIGYFSTQINQVKTNPGYDPEQKWPVPSCSLKQSLNVF